MFIAKEQPSPTDPAVIDQLKSLSKKLDALTKQNEVLSLKTAELEVRVRARSVSCASSFPQEPLLHCPAKLMLD